METKINELLDRLSILLIKVEEIGKPSYKEFVAYASELLLKSNVDFNIAIKYLRELNKINRDLWNVELEFSTNKKQIYKKKAEGAEQVRRLNNKRVKLRNKISEEMGGFIDTKKGYFEFDK